MSSHKSHDIGAGTAPLIGRSLQRVEDARFVTGTGTFIDDMKVENMVHALVVRSPHAHARIGAIDTTELLAHPGIIDVFTTADIAEYAAEIPLRLAPLVGYERYLQRPFAVDKVLYVGDPVAVIVADSRYIAEDAQDLLMIDYEILPAVTDVHASAKNESILNEKAGTNVAFSYRVSEGDIEAAFAAADYTRKESFYCHRHSGVPLETRGMIASYDATATDHKLKVWGATKVPWFNRRALAKMLRMEEADIRFVETDVGGAFGIRGEFYPEDFLIPFATMRVKRPVKWIEDRREHLMAANHSREMECDLEIALSKDGDFLGLRGVFRADMGAYARTNGGVPPAKAAQFAPGPYRVGAVQMDVAGLMTNKTPIGTYRGPGRYEVNFFRERLLDLAAADLGISPVALRMKNLIPADMMPYTTGKLCPYEEPVQYDQGDYPGTLAKIAEAFDFDRMKAKVEACGQKNGKRQGVGLAVFVESGGAGPSETARIEVTPTGKIEVFTGVTAQGQGHETVLAQICSDGMGGVPFGDISIFHGDTDKLEWGFGTYHGRGVTVGGSAILLTARKLAAQLVAMAARRTNLGIEELELKDGAIRKKGAAPGEPPVMTLEALAASADDPAELKAVEKFAPANRTYTSGAHAAHVEVDVETGKVEVLRYLIVEDVGRCINPALVHGQAIGGAVQGIGATFLDELVYDAEGQLLTGSFADYLMATSNEFPEIEAITLETSLSTLNPLGAKGAGEGGIVGAGGALANAVSHALGPLGVNVTSLPLNPNNVLRMIRQATPRQAAE